MKLAEAANRHHQQNEHGGGDVSCAGAAGNNVACTQGTTGTCSLVAANNGAACDTAHCSGTKYIAGNYCNSGTCVSVPIECNYNTLTGTTWSGTKCSCNTASVCQSAASGYDWTGTYCAQIRAACLNVCSGNNYPSCITLSEGACCSGCQPPTYSYDYACPSLFGTAGAYSQY
jgi:hypothetical protein